MTQEPQSGTRRPRASHVVHTLPRDWGSLAKVLTPIIERVDPLTSAIQVVIVTADVESTVALSAGAFAHFGVQGIDVLPATGAARAARLLRTDPVKAIAGPPWVLRELLGTSALQVKDAKALVFAWIDDVIAEGGEALADLETLISEAPKEATRELVVRDVTPAVERFIERHLHQALRLGTVGSMPSRVSLSYVSTTATARPGALRRVLDEIDPPSAVVLVRSDESEAEAKVTLRQLGYRRADDVVRVSRGDVPQNTHTVILYDTPLDGASLEAAAASRPTFLIALVEAREIETLARLTSERAQPLPSPAHHPRARRADELLRRELRQLLDAGFGAREVMTVEPLLSEYDAAEVAGALVRLLEREREKRALAAQAPAQREWKPRDRGDDKRGARPERGARGERGGAPRGPSDGRGPRGDERPRRHEADSRDRPPRREFRDRPTGGDRGRPSHDRRGPRR